MGGSGSFLRMVVTSLVFETRTVDGMIEYPVGSGPMNETNRQVRPPSSVRCAKGRPSRPFAFEAVSKSVQSFGPLTEVVGTSHHPFLIEEGRR